MPAPSWKMIYLARRNPALRFDEFPQAWREHSTLGRQCTNVQDKVVGVTQCVRLDPAAPGTQAGYDGLNLLRLRDREAADSIWSDPDTLRVMRPDEPRVFDRYVREFTVVAQETVWHDGPCGDAVLAGFLQRAPGHDSQQTLVAVAQACAGLPLPPQARLVGNRVEPQRPAGYDFDVIVELWLPGPAELLAACVPDGWLPQLQHALHDSTHSSANVWMATRVSHRRP